jgi:hypothetical protein
LTDFRGYGIVWSSMDERVPNNQIEAIIALEKLEKRTRLRATRLLAQLPDDLVPAYKARAKEESAKGTI